MSDPKNEDKVMATGSYTYSLADATYVRLKKKRGGGHVHEDEGAGELNIVPFLDILINLIMFMLVSQATLISLGVVDVTAPTYAPNSVENQPKTPEDPNKPPKKDLKLTLGVAKKGYYIAAQGGVLPGEEPPKEGEEVEPQDQSQQEPTIPLKSDGTYDYLGLSRKLRAIKTVFPDARAVFFAADQEIPYEVVVKTLDASREDSSGLLFPDVAFSRIN